MSRCVDIAPMMGWTDRHGRFLMQLLSRHARLWTEMIPAQALVYGPGARLLAFEPCANESVLQLGGASPQELAQAARLGEAAGYDEINLNMGCPSCRVGAGGFGAKLMLMPDLAVSCAAAIMQAVDIPVSVKCRIGVDDQEPEKTLPDFIHLLHRAGLDHFIIHARKALLKGLSPRQNRSVPPLNHRLVYQLKSDFPDAHFVINGGVETLDDVQKHLARMDGVMIGRAAFRNSFMLSSLDRRFFGALDSPPSRYEVLRDFMDYALRHNLPKFKIIRLASGLWSGQKSASHFRRVLREMDNISDMLAAMRALDESMALAA